MTQRPSLADEIRQIAAAQTLADAQRMAERLADRVESYIRAANRWGTCTCYGIPNRPGCPAHGARTGTS